MNFTVTLINHGNSLPRRCSAHAVDTSGEDETDDAFERVNKSKAYPNPNPTKWHATSTVQGHASSEPRAIVYIGVVWQD